MDIFKKQDNTKLGIVSIKPLKPRGYQRAEELRINHAIVIVNTAKNFDFITVKCVL